MKIKRFLLAAAMLAAPLFVGSAMATDWEALDEEYEQCKARYVRDGFGNYDQAAAWCYDRVYGGETSPYPGKDPSLPKY